MKICIPHYTQLLERRQSLELVLREMGLEAMWITDFDQEEVTEELEKHFVDPHFLRERAAITEQASGGKLYPETPLKRSEISLALKHLKIFREHAESPEGFVVVLEDDVQFCRKNFLQDFEKKLAKTPDDWDMIFFGNSGIFYEKNVIRRFWNRLMGRTIFLKSHPATRCLDSYVIKSHAAEKLGHLVQQIALPLDWELNYWIKKLDLKVYWWEPGLTRQGSQTGKFFSSIRE